jgi:hypothetical protein
VAFVLGFDEKFGIGDDVFEERNVTVWALNGGAPTMVYLDAIQDLTQSRLNSELNLTYQNTLRSISLMCRDGIATK